MAEGGVPQTDDSGSFWQRFMAIAHHDILGHESYDYAGLCRFYENEAKPFIEEEKRRSKDAHIHDVLNAWKECVQARIHFLYVLGE